MTRREVVKKYYDRNREKINKYRREYYHRTKEQFKEKIKRYSAKSREKNRKKINEWHKEHRQEAYARRNKNKKNWMALLSELNLLMCHRCGYNKCFAAIDYHHINPEEKEMEIGKVLDYLITSERILELKKTIPLCKVCHTELHTGLWSLAEGEVS